MCATRIGQNLRLNQYGGVISLIGMVFLLQAILFHLLSSHTAVWSSPPELPKSMRAFWQQPIRQSLLNYASAQARKAYATVTFVVDTDDDDPDTNPGDGACQTSADKCSLRAAIEEANERPGTELIQFNIKNPDRSCPDVVTIQPGSSLVIDDQYNNGMTIDGYTQCDASPNTLTNGGNAGSRSRSRVMP